MSSSSDASAVIESIAPPGFRDGWKPRHRSNVSSHPTANGQGGSGRRFNGYDPLRIYETAIPGLVIAEFRANGEVAATGEPFSLDYIHVYRISAGKIVSLRDYWSPIAIASLPNASSGNAQDNVAVDAAELQ